MRKLEINGKTYLWKMGEGHLTIVRPEGTIHPTPYEVSGVNASVFERGQWKGTSDGMVTPGQVTEWLKRWEGLPYIHPRDYAAALEKYEPEGFDTLLAQGFALIGCEGVTLAEAKRGTLLASPKLEALAALSNLVSEKWNVARAVFKDGRLYKTQWVLAHLDEPGYMSCDQEYQVTAQTNAPGYTYRYDTFSQASRVSEWRGKGDTVPMELIVSEKPWLFRTP